jgi:hypothetical protein
MDVLAATDFFTAEGPISCQKRLGGLLKYYERAAA